MCLGGEAEVEDHPGSIGALPGTQEGRKSSKLWLSRWQAGLHQSCTPLLHVLLLPGEFPTICAHLRAPALQLIQLIRQNLHGGNYYASDLLSRTKHFRNTWRKQRLRSHTIVTRLWTVALRSHHNLAGTCAESRNTHVCLTKLETSVFMTRPRKDQEGCFCRHCLSFRMLRITALQGSQAT